MQNVKRADLKSLISLTQALSEPKRRKQGQICKVLAACALHNGMPNSSETGGSAVVDRAALTHQLGNKTLSILNMKTLKPVAL